MDALNFKYTQDQYDQRPITRELNKCFCAFFNPPKSVCSSFYYFLVSCNNSFFSLVVFFLRPFQTSRPIATGNWGCGAFNGDLELKYVTLYKLYTRSIVPVITTIVVIIIIIIIIVVVIIIVVIVVVIVITITITITIITIITVIIVSPCPSMY